MGLTVLEYLMRRDTIIYDDERDIETEKCNEILLNRILNYINYCIVLLELVNNPVKNLKEKIYSFFKDVFNIDFAIFTDDELEMIVDELKEIRKMLITRKDLEYKLIISIIQLLNEIQVSEITTIIVILILSITLKKDLSDDLTFFRKVVEILENCIKQ